jgi:hypothetical protein
MKLECRHFPEKEIIVINDYVLQVLTEKVHLETPEL